MEWTNVNNINYPIVRKFAVKSKFTDLEPLPVLPFPELEIPYLPLAVLPTEPMPPVRPKPPPLLPEHPPLVPTSMGMSAAGSIGNYAIFSDPWGITYTYDETYQLGIIDIPQSFKNISLSRYGATYSVGNYVLFVNLHNSNNSTFLVLDNTLQSHILEYVTNSGVHYSQDYIEFNESLIGVVSGFGGGFPINFVRYNKSLQRDVITSSVPSVPSLSFVARGLATVGKYLLMTTAAGASQASTFAFDTNFIEVHGYTPDGYPARLSGAFRIMNSPPAGFVAGQVENYAIFPFSTNRAFAADVALNSMLIEPSRISSHMVGFLTNQAIFADIALQRIGINSYTNSLQKRDWSILQSEDGNQIFLISQFASFKNKHLILCLAREILPSHIQKVRLLIFQAAENAPHLVF